MWITCRHHQSPSVTIADSPNADDVAEPLVKGVLVVDHDPDVAEAIREAFEDEFIVFARP
jgi:hypothetical protein